MTVDLNPQFTFETLVVGAANRLAATAARSVARAPGSTYNPLFIYSASGLGKTHLLMAIGHAAGSLPDATVEYVTLDELVDAFRAALGQGEGETFRRRFREVDVLLIDDVQFLSDRRELQTELLRIIETVQRAGHQIVLASDRPPADIANLDERLISRFAGGLVIDIGRPDYETRVAILRRKLEQRGTEMAPAVVEVVAEAEVTNVRELLGRMNRLVALQAVSDGPFGPEEARSALGHHPQSESAAPSASPKDEFSQFVSELAATVARTVEAWRERVAQAILRWEGEGYRTRALEALLEQESPPDVDEALRAYEQAVMRLRELQAMVEALDADAAGDAVFRDPARVSEAETLAERVREGLQPPPGPSATLTFEGFARGSSNHVAVNSAMAAIREPGKKYNPLVIVGPTGVGKSHLLHAIGNALARREGMVVACLSTQQFIEDLIAAIDADRVEWWRARYRRCDALLLDDVHLVAGKERTQDELFHLFNALAAGDRQLVFTLRAVPDRLKGLEPRLVSRLSGGLLVELEPPDRDVRLAVIERLLAEHGVEDEGLTAYLADRSAQSVRTVQGEVHRVVSAADASGAPPTAARARAILEGLEERRSVGAAAPRTSGLVVTSAGGIRSREKMVWDWPDVRDRIIEELG